MRPPSYAPERLHDRIVDEPHRLAECALEVEADPPVSEVTRLGVRSVDACHTWKADRDHVVAPVAGVRLHLMHETLGRQIRAGREASLHLSHRTVAQLHVRTTDVDHEHIHIRVTLIVLWCKIRPRSILQAMSITGTVVHSAETRFVEAAAVLQPYVGCFWVITAQRGATIRVVPDGSTAIFVERRANRSSGWLLARTVAGPSRAAVQFAGNHDRRASRPGVAFLVTSRAADTMLGRASS
jgi:hypothetical protein